MSLGVPGITLDSMVTPTLPSPRSTCRNGVSVFYSYGQKSLESLVIVIMIYIYIYYDEDYLLLLLLLLLLWLSSLALLP